MARGERFADVENVINATDLSADEKSALWLLAWSYVHPSAQRREANAHFRIVADAGPPRSTGSARHLRVVASQHPGDSLGPGPA